MIVMVKNIIIPLISTIHRQSFFMTKIFLICMLLNPWHAEYLYFLSYLKTLRPRQNGCHFVDDIFKCIFLNEKFEFRLKLRMKFVPKGPINNIPALVQIMAWRRPGHKPLSEAMMVSLPMHICVTRPQWVNAEMLQRWKTGNWLSWIFSALYVQDWPLKD